MLTLKNIGSIVKVNFNGKSTQAVVEMVVGNNVKLTAHNGQVGITDSIANVKVIELNTISESELVVIETLVAKIEAETELVESSFEEGEEDYYEAMEETVEPLEKELRSVIKSIIA